MVTVKRTKAEDLIGVSVDYHSKNVQLSFNPAFWVSSPAEARPRLLLNKREVTALIKALKSQRDRKGTK